eukprot:1864140-Pleurochrysis_carterae.AAC.1
MHTRPALAPDFNVKACMRAGFALFCISRVRHLAGYYALRLCKESPPHLTGVVFRSFCLYPLVFCMAVEAAPVQAIDQSRRMHTRCTQRGRERDRRGEGGTTATQR